MTCSNTKMQTSAIFSAESSYQNASRRTYKSENLPRPYNENRSVVLVSSHHINEAGVLRFWRRKGYDYVDQLVVDGQGELLPAPVHITGQQSVGLVVVVRNRPQKSQNHRHVTITVRTGAVQAAVELQLLLLEVSEEVLEAGEFLGGVFGGTTEDEAVGSGEDVVADYDRLRVAGTVWLEAVGGLRWKHGLRHIQQLLILGVTDK